MELTEAVKSTFKDAARKLTGNRKRDFIAKVTEDHFEDSARKAETVLGRNRHSVEKGLQERRTGIVCVNNYQARGCKKSEEKLPNIETDIRSLVDAQSQADPKFKSTFCDTRISARAVRESLIREKGYTETPLLTRQTIFEVRTKDNYGTRC